MILRSSNVNRAVFCNFPAENGFAEGKNALLSALIAVTGTFFLDMLGLEVLDGLKRC